MKAVRFHQYGDADVLRYEDVDQSPSPAPGRCASGSRRTTFNGVDANIRAGNMQGPMPVTLPHVPGLDVAGTVDALGDGRHGLAVGDRSSGSCPSSTTAPRPSTSSPPPRAWRRAPTRIPLADAAALPPGRAHRLAGAVRARRPQRRPANPDQRCRRRRRRLRRTAGQGGRRLRHRHRQPPQQPSRPRPGADEVIDHTTTEVDSTRSPSRVDVLLNLAPITPSSSPRWPPWSATAAWSSTPPCGCPPQPTRPRRARASTLRPQRRRPARRARRPGRPRRAAGRRRRAGSLATCLGARACGGGNPGRQGRRRRRR